MQRRFNYTGRQRIRKKDLSFTIAADVEGYENFYADLQLGNYNLPPDAEVWVEAYDRNALMRFPFGTVAEPNNETPTVLTDFRDSDSFYFRVKVVDALRRSRLLAVADSVSPSDRQDEDGAARSLLSVTTRDLGSVPWKLEYQPADHPLLVINNRIDAGKSLARSNLFFQALVLPAIFEQVLRQILLEQKYVPAAAPDDDDLWKEGWLEFAGCLPGNTLLSIDQEIPDDEKEKWIEDARIGFCMDINAIYKVKSELKEDSY